MRFVNYRGTDGMLHTWDAANRGGTPICGADTFFSALPEVGLLACADCASIAARIIVWGVDWNKEVWE